MQRLSLSGELFCDERNVTIYEKDGSYELVQGLHLRCDFSVKVDAAGRGVFRPRQTRQLPRAVDLKGRLLSCQSY